MKSPKKEIAYNLLLLLSPYLFFLSRYLNYYVSSPKYDYVMTISHFLGYYMLFFLIIVGSGLLLNILFRNKVISWLLMMILNLILYEIYSVRMLVIVLLTILFLNFLFRKINIKNNNILILL